MTVKDKDSTAVFLSASGMERKKKWKKEGEREQLLVGVDRAAPAHTDGSLWKERITCARLLSCHILIPSRAHLGTNSTPPPPNIEPLTRSFNPAAVSTSTAVLL